MRRGKNEDKRTFKVKALEAVRNKVLRGVPGWFSQLSINFSSGHDLTISRFEPHIGLCADSTEPALDSLSPCLSLCPSHACTLSNVNRVLRDNMKQERSVGFIKKKKSLFIYLENERECASRGEGHRDRERILSRLHSQCRARHRAQSQEL